MKEMKQQDGIKSAQRSRFIYALALTSLLSVSSLATLLPSAVAASNVGAVETGVTNKQLRRTDLSTQLSPRIVNRLRQDLSKRTGIPVGRLRVLEATRRTWPDLCLGIPNPDELCAQALTEGWRVVLSNGRQQWVYRTDLEGRVYRMERSSNLENSQSLKPTRIPANELPPRLQSNILFRSIATGGIAARTYQINLLNDGRVIQAQMNPMGTTLTSETIRRLSRQELRQFRQLLEQSALEEFDRQNYPATPGSADFFTVTLSSRNSTVRYADTIQNQLPRSLQEIIQAWNAITQRS